MSREVRSRIFLGIGIPLVAFLFLGALIFSFSRLLLAVPEEIAPWVALLFAVNILIGCALAATLPGRRSFTFLITLLVIMIVGGGIAGAVVGERPVERLVAEEEPPGEPPAPEPAPPPEAPAPTESPAQEGAEGGGSGGQEPPAEPVSIVAQGIAFDTQELSFRAEAPAAISFDNRDAGVPHNVALYTQQGGDPIFQGEIITGPATIEYMLTAPGAGTYYFQCDVHPQMNGSVTVA